MFNRAGQENTVENMIQEIKAHGARHYSEWNMEQAKAERCGDDQMRARECFYWSAERECAMFRAIVQLIESLTPSRELIGHIDDMRKAGREKYKKELEEV